MGKPIKIAEFARSMVRLSGMTVRDDANPDGDIEVIEIGLRPGEKLYEELLIGDNPEPTDHQQIMRAHEGFLSFDRLMPLLSQMDSALSKGDREDVRSLLIRLVPEFRGDLTGNAERDKIFEGEGGDSLVAIDAYGARG